MTTIFEQEKVLIINPLLAKIVGFEESVILQQIHYWLKKNKENNHNYQDGRYWTYSTYREWHERDFSIFNLRSMRRYINNLEKRNFLISGCFNKMKIDQTKWYSINYEEIERVAIEKGIMNPFQEVAPTHETECTTHAHRGGQIGQGTEKPHEIRENELITSVTDELNNGESAENEPNYADNQEPMRIGVAKLDRDYGQIGQGGGQIGHMDVAKMTKPLPDIKTETKKEIKKNSINNVPNFIPAEIQNLLDRESLNELPEEIKTAFAKPILKFLSSYHLTIEKAGEMITDVCERLTGDYEINNLEKFKGLLYTSIENEFLDHLLIQQGIDVPKYVANKRTEELKTHRKKVKMEYFALIASGNTELAATIEFNKPKSRKKSYKPNQPKGKPTRTEVLPDWFDKTYEPKEVSKEEQERNEMDFCIGLAKIRDVPVEEIIAQRQQAHLNAQNAATTI